MKSSCETLCEFTGRIPRIPFSLKKKEKEAKDPCAGFSFANVLGTYIHQKNDDYHKEKDLYPLPAEISSVNIDHNKELHIDKLNIDDYYSTDITKFAEWILKHNDHKKLETVFFVSHNESLQDIADKLNDEYRKEIKSNKKVDDLLRDARKTDLVLKNVKTNSTANDNTQTKYKDPEEEYNEDEDDNVINKTFPLNKHGRPYIDPKKRVYDFITKTIRRQGGRKKNHRKTNKKSRSRKSRR